MEDLSGSIQKILSDPGAMEQIRSLAGSLGLGAQDPSPPPQPPQPSQHSQPGEGASSVDLSRLLSRLSGALTGASSGSGSAAPAAPSPPAVPAASASSSGGLPPELLGLLGNLGGKNFSSPSPAGLFSGSENASGLLPQQGELLSSMMKLLPLLSTVQQETDSTRLLRALRPMLSAPKQKRLDEALRLMQLLRFLPLLKGTVF